MCEEVHITICGDAAEPVGKSGCSFFMWLYKFEPPPPVKYAYSDSIEGACGIILDAEAGVVIKRIRRHARKSHGAHRQCEIQQWASQLLTPANGFTVLFCPRAWAPEPRQYRMERIDCSVELEPKDVPELKRFYQLAREAGIFPCDYELYQQKDGRVALVDVDKFGQWYQDMVVFPWGQVWAEPDYPYRV